MIELHCTLNVFLNVVSMQRSSGCRVILAFPSDYNLKIYPDDHQEPIRSFFLIFNNCAVARFVFLETCPRLKQALMFLFLCSEFEQSRRGVSERGIIDLPELENVRFEVRKSPTSSVSVSVYISGVNC